MGFSSQEYWNGLPCPSPGDLLDPGIESRSPTLQADFFLQIELPWKPLLILKFPCSLPHFLLPPDRAPVFHLSGKKAGLTYIFLSPLS